MAENKKQETEKKTPGQKFDEGLENVKSFPKRFSEKHPKLVKFLKIGGTLAAGAGIVLLGDAAVDHFMIEKNDDDDAIDVNATEISEDEETSDDSGDVDEATEA